MALLAAKGRVRESFLPGRTPRTKETSTRGLRNQACAATRHGGACPPLPAPLPTGQRVRLSGEYGFQGYLKRAAEQLSTVVSHFFTFFLIVVNRLFLSGLFGEWTVWDGILGP